jgi:hypothetical protein
VAFTYKQANHGTASTIQLTGVVAGDLVFIAVAWALASGSVTVSDGTSSFTMRPAVANGIGFSVQGGYLLSSVKSGTVTYTISGETPSSVIVLEFSYSGVCTYDKGTGASGNSASLNSGNITTTGTDELALAIGDANTAPSSEQIDGLAADSSYASGAPLYAWWKAFASTFTGAATATITSGYWVCSIDSFIEAAYDPKQFPFSSTEQPIVEKVQVTGY